jgi:hypothetical protein
MKHNKNAQSIKFEKPGRKLVLRQKNQTKMTVAFQKMSFRFDPNVTLILVIGQIIKIFLRVFIF